MTLEKPKSGPFSPRYTGRLLDLPVWTDTNSGGSQGCKGCGDPYHLIRCDMCGWPLEKCICVPGKDY